jgi:anti-anti-sigma factor
LAAKVHEKALGGEAMMRTEENTMVPLAAHDEIALPRLEHLSLLQMRCATLHMPTGEVAKVLRIAGSVDSSTSEELLAKIELLLGADHRSQVILDLEGVARVDSSGVGVLLTALRDAQKRGVRFTLCGLPKPLHTMLERMRLANLFEMRNTLEETLNL